MCGMNAGRGRIPLATASEKTSRKNAWASFRRISCFAFRKRGEGKREREEEREGEKGGREKCSEEASSLCSKAILDSKRLALDAASENSLECAHHLLLDLGLLLQPLPEPGDDFTDGADLL